MNSTPGTPDTPDQKRLALRVAGVLWSAAALMILFVPLLPGGDTRHWQVLLVAALIGLAWGLACLVMPPRWGRPLVFLVPSVLALGIVGAVVASTGGHEAPLGLLLFFLVAFCSYFYSPALAAPFIVGAVAVNALPLLYDPGAVRHGVVGEAVTAGAAYIVLGAVILFSKGQLMRAQREAQELSLTDSLTGLANRRALMDLLKEHVGGERASDASGLLMVDLDDFKDANTLYGHPGGDTVLRAAADALRTTARGGDLVARLGGDEFAIVARGADPHGMSRLADRALDAIRGAQAALNLPGFTLTASAGWALYPENASTIDELITSADMALRGAKILGKDRSQPPVERLPDAAR
jgi:diguanylate cyclase (GGDEF)-like protein